MSVRRGGGPRRGFLRPRTPERPRPPSTPDVPKPVVRRVPTLDQNIERAIRDVQRGATVTLDAFIEGVETGFITLADRVIDVLEAKPKTKTRRHPSKKKASPGIFAQAERLAGVVVPPMLAGELFLGVGLVGAAIGREYKEHRAEEVRRAEEAEHRQAEKLIERRIDEAHDRAGRELRSNPAFRKEFNAAQIDAAADALETYSSQKFFKVIARHSGLSTWEVASYNDVSDVRVYSEDTIDAYMAWQRSRFATPDAVVMQKMEESARGNAGLHYAGLVCLNLSHIINKADTPDMVHSRVLDVLYHEEMHGFRSYLTAEQIESDEGLDMFAEGTNELLANMTMWEIHGDNNSYAGYVDGPTATAAVAYESLPKKEQSVVWSSHVTGRIDEYQKAYNAHFGKNAMAEMIYANDLYIGPDANAWITQSNIKGYSDAWLRDVYDGIAPLNAALANAGDDWQSVAERANAHLRKGLIVPIRGKNLNGVLLADSGWEDGLIGGVLTLDGSKGRRLVLLQGAQQSNAFIVLPGTNAAALYVDLDVHSILRKNLEEQTFEERGAAAVNMLRPYRTQLIHYREM